MKKYVLAIVAVLFSVNIYSQVGINTDDPKSTLDIRQNTSFVYKGLLVPRLTSTEVLAMSVGSDQNSMMIYLNDAVPLVSRTGRFLHMSISAHYYYSFSKDLWLRYLDSDINDLPTGFERLPNMSAANFHWRLIGAAPANYGTAGKYALDATWNPADLSETIPLGGALGTLSYSTILAAAGLTTADLGAKGINSFASGTLNSATGNLSTATGAANTASGNVSFVAGGLNRSTGLYSVSIGAINLSSGIASFAAGASSEATGDTSIAMGNTSKASGENAVAMGQANTASAQGALALGNTNTASAISAVGIGQQNTASGQGSLALGNTNTTSATSSVAIGQTNINAGQASVVIGNTNNVSVPAINSVTIGFGNIVAATGSFVYGNSNLSVNANESFILGRSNESVAGATRATVLGASNKIGGGVYNTAIGFSNESLAGSSYSNMLGRANKVEGLSNVAVGTGLTASSAYSTAMGLYNTIETSPELGGFADNTKRLFVVGNGTSLDKSDALTILRNGKIGIDIDNFENTTSTAMLQVNGDINMVPKTATSTCNSSNEGSIQYIKADAANGKFQGCKQTAGVFDWADLH